MTAGELSREEIATCQERMTRHLLPTRRQVESLITMALALLDLRERIETLLTYECEGTQRDHDTFEYYGGATETQRAVNAAEFRLLDKVREVTK